MSECLARTGEPPDAVSRMCNDRMGSSIRGAERPDRANTLFAYRVFLPVGKG